MSLAVEKPKLLKVMDPRLNLNREIYYPVQQPGAQVNYRTISATSSSPSSILFNNQAPNSNTAIDRLVMLTLYLQFDLVGDTGDGGIPIIKIGDNDALASNVVNKAISTARLTINNNVISANIKDYEDVLLRYLPTEDKRRMFSGCPCMQDNRQTFDDAFNAVVNNVLSGYDGAYEGSIPPRGAFDYVASGPNGNGVPGQLGARVKVKVSAPLMLPPLTYSKHGKKAFYHVDQFELELNLISNLVDLWSHTIVGDNAFSGASSVSFYSEPQLGLTYITPQSVGTGSRTTIPPSIKYTYFDPTRYVKNIGVIDAGVPSRTSSQSIQLNQIPSQMYVWIAETDASKAQSVGQTNPNVYAGITGLSMTFNNVAGILGGASTEQIYKMCVENGLNMTYYQFTKQIGSPVCIDFGKDISLAESSLAVGTLGSFEMLLDVNFTNLSPRDINYDLYILVINDGIMTLSKGQCVLNSGILSRNDVLEAAQLEPSIYEDQLDYVGGNVFSKFKEGLKKAEPYAKKAVQLSKKYGPVAAKAASELIPLLMSAGYSREEAEEMAKHQSAGLIGGKKVSKGQSKKMKSRF